MPLHKNGDRVKRMTLLFDQFFKSEPFGQSFQIVGVLQDWYSDTLNASGQNPDDVIVTFGGELAQFGKIRQRTSTTGFYYEVNCIDNADVNHVYTASEWRNNVLRCFQDNTWIGDTGDLIVSPLGSFSPVTTDGKSSIEWESNETNLDPLVFPSPILVNANRELETNTDALDQITFPKSRFTPSAANYSHGNRALTLIFPAGANVFANEYWDVDRQFGTARSNTGGREWLGTVTGRSTLADGMDEVILNIVEGDNLLDSIGGSDGDVEIFFQASIPFFVVVTSDEALQVLDDVATMNSGYTFEGSNTNADLLGPVILGTSNQDVNGAEIEIINTTTTAGQELRIRAEPRNNLTLDDGQLTFTGNPGQGTGFVLSDDHYDTPALADAVVTTDNVVTLPGSPVVYPNGDGTFDAGVAIAQTTASTAADMFKVIQFLLFRTDNTTAWKGIEIFRKDGEDNTLEVFNDDGTSLGLRNNSSSVGGWTVGDSVVIRNIPINILQSFADDPNREIIGNNLGVRMFGTSVRGEDSGELNDAGQTYDQWIVAGNAGANFISNGIFGPGQLPMITMGRGASLTLNRGFIWNISVGYDMNFVAADGELKTEDLAVIKYDTEVRAEHYDIKFGWDGGRDERFIAKQPPSTPTNPMTVNQLSGSSFQVSNVTGDAPQRFLNNNVFVGSANAQFLDVAGRLVWNSDGQPSVGIFSNPGFLNARWQNMPGTSTGRTVVLDYDDSDRQVITQYGAAIKNFGGEDIIINDGSLLISSNNELRNDTIVGLDYDRNVTILGNYTFSGAELDPTLGAFVNRGLYFMLYNITYNNLAYFDTFSFASGNNVESDRGSARLGVLWNPSWVYDDAPASNLFESYYYGDNSATTLTPVKEMLEQGQIGEGGIQAHPWAAGIAEIDQRTETSTIPNDVPANSFFGVTLSAQKSQYDPLNSLDSVTLNDVDITDRAVFNDNASSPALTIAGPANAGDTLIVIYTLIQDLSLINVSGGNSRYARGTGFDADGILLAYSVGQPATTENPTGGEILITPFMEDWFSYTRRDGFRPYFTHKSFLDDFDTLERTVDLNAGLDGSWQTTDLTAMDILAADVEDRVVFYDQATNTVSWTLNALSSWNTNYVLLEVAENRGNVSNANLRPAFEPATLNYNGLFNRTVNDQIPVTSGLMNITDYDTRIDLAGFGIIVDTSVVNSNGVLEGLANNSHTVFLVDSSVANTSTIAGRITAENIVNTTVGFTELTAEVVDTITTGLIDITDNSILRGATFSSPTGLNMVTSSRLEFAGGDINTGSLVAQYDNATVNAATYSGEVDTIQNGSVFTIGLVNDRFITISDSTINFTTMNGNINRINSASQIIGTTMNGEIGTPSVGDFINESTITIGTLTKPIRGEVMDSTIRINDVEFESALSEETLIFSNNILANANWTNVEADGLVNATLLDSSIASSTFNFTEVVLRNFQTITLNRCALMTDVDMVHGSGLPPVNLTTTAIIDGTSNISARSVLNVGGVRSGTITASSSFQSSGDISGGSISAVAFAIPSISGGSISGQLASTIAGDASSGVITTSSQPLMIGGDISGDVIITAAGAVSAIQKTGGTMSLFGGGSVSFTGQTGTNAIMTAGSIGGGEVNGLIPSTGINTQTFTDTVLNLTTASTPLAPAVGFTQASSGTVILGEGPAVGTIEFIAGGLNFTRDNTAANNANIIIVAPYSTTVTVPAGMNAYLFVGPPGARLFDRLLPPGINTITESDFSVGTQVTIIGLGSGFSQVSDGFIAGDDYVLVPVAFSIPITATIADDAIVNVFVTPEDRFVVVMNNSLTVNPRDEVATSAWAVAAIHEKVVGGVTQTNTDGNTYQQALADWVANKVDIFPGPNIILFQVNGGELVQYDETRWEIDGDASSDRTLGYILAIQADGTQLADNSVLSRPNVNDKLLNVFPIPTSTSAEAIVELQLAGLKVELNTRKVTEGTLQNSQLLIPAFGPDQ